jgi:AraC-like DNA-binding protein
MEKNSNSMCESFSQYLTFSEEDEKLGMVCTDVGYTNVRPNTIYPPRISDHPTVFRPVAEGRTLPEFQLQYVTTGEGIFGIDGKTYAVKPGSILLVLPGQKHYYKPVYEIGWDEYWVGFNGSFFTKLVEEGILSRKHSYIEIGLHEAIITIFNQIFNEVRVQQPLYQFKACTGILSLIAEISTHQRRKEQPNNYQLIVEKAKYLMESNIYSAINLSSISEQIGISTSRLHEIFKTYTSMTPYQYYIHIKILRAESLLEEENLSIKEVAYRMGFEDQYHFSRLFKNKTGIAPSEWRKFIYQ